MTASEYHRLLLARLNRNAKHSLHMADEAGKRGDTNEEAWWRDQLARDMWAEEMAYQLDPQWFIVNRAVYKTKS